MTSQFLLINAIASVPAWLFTLVIGCVIGWIALPTVTRTTTTVESGREQYESSGVRESVRSRLADSDVPIERIDKRDPSGPPTPTLHDDVSTMIVGQTGNGKSTFVKERIDKWDFDGAVIAHALSEADADNEFVEFFENRRDQDVVKISSRNSTHRWDPLLDFGRTLRGLETLSRGLFRSRDAKETGWFQPAQTLLMCALVVTMIEEKDFAALPDIATRGPMRLVKNCEELSKDRTRSITRPIRDMDEEDRSAVQTTMLNQLRPLFLSDIVDDDLPRVSLKEYLAEPDEKVIVCDNIRRDRHASPFWRLFLQSAIDLSYGAEGKQQFLLDEFDKLPRIENLPGLASAGRSAGVVGVLVAQDLHQVEDRYGDLAKSLWTNCPNRAAFRLSDMETADLVLSGIGRYEMKRQSLSAGSDPDDQRVSTSIAVQQPIVSGDLMSLDIGEALIQSREGWWLGKLEEPDISKTALPQPDEGLTAESRFRRFARKHINDTP